MNPVSWTSPRGAALLGVCPLLAASGTVEQGLALGVASLVVLCASNVLAAALLRWIAPRLRTGAMLVLVGALVTAVDLVFQARWFELHGQVSLFVPLIVANGLMACRAENFAVDHGLWRSLLDGLAYGAGIVVLLAGVGAVRDLVTPGLLVASLPAGALFLLAAVIALRQAWLGRRGNP